MNDSWIQSQVKKYANPKKGFGEADKVVELNLKAYQQAICRAKKGVLFLDLGTNSGRVAYEAKKKGAVSLGVDLPEVIAQIKYDVDLVAMDLEKDYPEGEWDVIFCRETIEHLRNYAEVCKKIIRSLTSNGILIITAPRDKRDSGKNCPEHVRVFEEDELDNLVKKSGGQIVKAFNERRQRVVITKKIK